MKKVLKAAAAVLLLLIVGFLGYNYLKKPEAGNDDAAAERYANPEIREISRQIQQELEGYEVTKEDGTTISANDLFIETEDGTYMPKESEIAQIDADSAVALIEEISRSRAIDPEQAREYAKQLAKMPEVQKKAMEYVMGNGIDIESILGD